MNQPTRTRPLLHRGFSLIELMIALALGLAIVAAVGTLSVNATRSYRSMNRASEQIENGRYALKVIKDDLEHAGFFGIFSPTRSNAPAPAFTDPCIKTPENYEKSLLLPVIGYSASPGTCALNVDSATNILTIRRAGINIISPSELQGSTAYIQSSSDKYVIGVKPDSTWLYAPAGNNGFSLHGPDGAYPIRPYETHIYYLSSQTLMLKNAVTNATAQPIIDGIENMQIQYGIDNTNQDGSPDTYLANPNSVENWSNVVSIRINLLARSNEQDLSYVDQKTYDLGGSQRIPAKNDHYHRRVFSQVVRLINVSQRREQ